MRPVHVVASNLSTDHPRQHYVIDHDNRASAAWLASQVIWAMYNNYQVTVYPTTEKVTFVPQGGSNGRRR